jgi:hypothetical protein
MKDATTQRTGKSIDADATAPPRAVGLLRRKCACGRHTVGGASCAECGGKRPALRRRRANDAESSATEVPASVNNTLQSSGSPLDSSTRSFFESRFGHDFSRVRVHSDTAAQRSARDVSAQAYTVGSDIVFGAGRLRPDTHEGRLLLAHELTHVVQQSSAEPLVRPHVATKVAPGSAAGVRASGAAPAEAQEAEADRVAECVVRGSAVPDISRGEGGLVQRTIEMRDVGRGGASGFARLPELIERINEVSRGLTFRMDGANLVYERRDGATLSDFDQQMMEFIDQAAVIPMRLTNRHGLEGDQLHGFHQRVEGDSWGSGYVDMDDLLASTPLGLQVVLVHVLRERSATRNYARRIGSPSTDLNLPGPRPEFRRMHRAGINSEVRMLRDFFGDPTIRFVNEPAAGEIFRVYRNDRGDRIRARETPGRGTAHAGEDAISIEVRTRDGRTLTPDEYRQLLEDERAAAGAGAPAAPAPAPATP